MEKARVLVTGFPAFAGGEHNISQQIVTELNRIGSSEVVVASPPRVHLDGRPEQDDMTRTVVVEWQTDVLACDREGADRTAARLSAGDWQAVLHLGLCDSCKVPRLERVASNELRMRVSDNSGRRIVDGIICQDGPRSLHTTAPLHRLSLETLVCEVEISEDAGGFVCNETFYRSLQAIEEQASLDRHGRPLPCIFLHLPAAEDFDADLQLLLVKQIGAWLVVRPRIVVACAVLEGTDGRFISCRRSPTESFSGCWEFPGGKVERGESVQQALQREIDEELSVEIEVVRPLGVHLHRMASVEIELHAWHCRISAGEPYLAVHDRLRWLDVEQFLEVDWIDADLPLIRDIQRRLISGEPFPGSAII